MKYLLGHFIGAVSICLVGVPLLLASDSTKERDDFSTPERAFRSIGEAVARKDARTVYKHRIDAPLQLSYGDFLKWIWEPELPMESFSINITDPKSFLSGSETILKSGDVNQYFREAQFLALRRELRAEKEIMRTYLLFWPKLHLLREESFLLKTGEREWRWQGDWYSQDMKWPGEDTPTSSYLSLYVALRKHIPELVVAGLASSVRKNRTSDELLVIIAKRLSAPRLDSPLSVWPPVMQMAVSSDDITEEYLSSLNGNAVCRVNHIEPQNQRHISSELFIKEGDEWKWLPDEKSFWRLDLPMPDNK